ncbi:MAG TPA: hypothetical protein VLX29_07590 [Nitrospirota bacterium]|nr:hypothetical protein [Nitrospirota bacterium]
MKTFHFFACIVLLYACVPKQPMIPITEVPAGPGLQALESRQHFFRGIKAEASVEIRKWGKKRILENVGIVLDGVQRFRMEVYGPLGQTIMALIWDGRKALVRVPESDKDTQQAQRGIADFLAEGIDMQEICAALSGNIPELIKPYVAAQFCTWNNDCLLEIHSTDSMRKVQMAYATSDSAQKPQPLWENLYQSGKLVYSARFSKMEDVSQYSMPMKVEIEYPNSKIVLTIEYHDIVVDTQISDDIFSLQMNEK